MPPKPSAKNVGDAVETIGKITYIGLNHVTEKWKGRIVNYGENGLVKVSYLLLEIVFRREVN